MEQSLYTFSSFDSPTGSFEYKTSDESKGKLIIKLSIALSGKTGEKERQVDVTRNPGGYSLITLVNPFLTAQSDIIEVSKEGSDRTIGYILPGAALLDDGDSENEEFNEYRQAYKFYAIRKLLDLNGITTPLETDEEGSMEQFVNEDCCYLIVYGEMNLTYFLPFLAVKGYYHLADGTEPKIHQLTRFKKQDEIEGLIKDLFHVLRGSKKIKLRNSGELLETSEMIRYLYTNLLVEADNPLYRFLILYQVIEYLVDVRFSFSIDELISKRKSYTDYNFIKKLSKSQDTRTAINALFAGITIDGVTEYIGIFTDFIKHFDSEFDKDSIADCLYDVRNTLFHDYKTVIAKKKDDGLVSLVIQCENVIHQLVIGYAKKHFSEKVVQLSIFQQN